MNDCPMYTPLESKMPAGLKDFVYHIAPNSVVSEKILFALNASASVRSDEALTM